jgi:hypothetical protein
MNGQTAAVPGITERHVEFKVTKSDNSTAAELDIVDSSRGRKDSKAKQETPAVSEISEHSLNHQRAKFKNNSLIWSSVRNCHVEPTKIVLLEIELVIT